MKTMNRKQNTSSRTDQAKNLGLDEDSFGRRAVALLEEGSRRLDDPIQNKLYQARVRALAIAREHNLGLVSNSLLASPTNLGFSSFLNRNPLWSTLGWLAPLSVLVFGIMLIGEWQNDQRINDIAAVDLALLTDEVPPVAYTDDGFLAYLKLANIVLDPNEVKQN
ncbi:MAG: DUF3619 family protein [Polynucleobacter sp.]|jgi:hypothetical protein|nr:DUF3619 family protein [Polynucleobacter sp.]